MQFQEMCQLNSEQFVFVLVVEAAYKVEFFKLKIIKMKCQSLSDNLQGTMFV